MKRNDEVMQKFAKALWNVLKQYHKKLEVSDNEVQNLKEALNKKTTEIIELEKQLKDSESSSCQISFKESSDSEAGSSSLEQLLISNDAADVTEIVAVVDANHISAAICKSVERYPVTKSNPESHVTGTLLDANLTDGDESKISSSVEPNALSADVKPDRFQREELSHEHLEVSISSGVKKISSKRESIETLSEDSSCQVRSSQVDSEKIPSPSTEIFTRAVEDKMPRGQSCDFLKGKEYDNEDLEEGNVTNVKEMIHFANFSERAHLDMSISTLQPSNATRDAEYPMNEHKTLHEEEQSELHPSHVEDAMQNNKSRVKNPMGKENLESDSKSSNGKKPKRRLLPASAMLLKSFSGLDMEVENLKESRGKVLAEGAGRSKGSKSLVHLLKNNLH